jgi:hypothetical protein
MRRGSTIVLAVLLLAALAVPVADAAHNRRTPRDAEEATQPPEEEHEEEDEPTPSRSTAPAAPRKSTSRDDPLESIAEGLDEVPTPVGIAVAGLVGLAALGLALLAAKRAFHPPPPKPPRKSFAAGRAKGVRDGIRGSQAALEALARSGLGDLASVAPEGNGYKVILKRGRGVPCEHAAGYLTGLFEAAWALDVHLEHPVCGGKSREAPCVFQAFPAPPTAPRRGAPTSSGRGAAAASTRG